MAILNAAHRCDRIGAAEGSRHVRDRQSKRLHSCRIDFDRDFGCPAPKDVDASHPWHGREQRTQL